MLLNPQEGISGITGIDGIFISKVCLLGKKLRHFYSSLKLSRPLITKFWLNFEILDRTCVITRQVWSKLEEFVLSKDKINELSYLAKYKWN